MENEIKFRDIHLTRLEILRHVFSDSYIYDGNRGKIDSTFGCIKKGEATFVCKNNTFSCTAGDFFYIPDGIIYESYWSGNPEIEFYITNFRFTVTKPGNVSLDRLFALQKVILPDFEQIAKKTESLYYIQQKSPALAIARFYDIFNEIYPFLKKEKLSSINPAVLPAVTYIERHLEENYDVAFLADLCHLSESHFYSLFKKSLKYTPIEYKNHVRIKKSIYYLNERHYPIEKVCELLNFNSTAYFSKVFKKFTGMAPGKYDNSLI